MPGKTATAMLDKKQMGMATNGIQNLQLHLVEHDDSSSNLGVTYFETDQSMFETCEAAAGPRYSSLGSPFWNGGRPSLGVLVDSGWIG